MTTLDEKLKNINTKKWLNHHITQMEDFSHEDWVNWIRKMESLSTKDWLKWVLKNVVGVLAYGRINTGNITEAAEYILPKLNKITSNQANEAKKHGAKIEYYPETLEGLIQHLKNPETSVNSGSDGYGANELVYGYEIDSEHAGFSVYDRLYVKVGEKHIAWVLVEATI